MKKSICILSLAFLAVGCGGQEEPATDEATESTQEQPAETQRDVVRREDRQSEPEQLPRRDDQNPEKRIPRMQGEGDEEGYGLTMVVDGSTPEAFKQSLELIAMDTSEAQYREFDAALRFLGTYDTAAWQGLPNLYATLDGMTAEEIIERARKMRDERRR